LVLQLRFWFHRYVLCSPCWVYPHTCHVTRYAHVTHVPFYTHTPRAQPLPPPAHTFHTPPTPTGCYHPRRTDAPPPADGRPQALHAAAARFDGLAGLFYAVPCCGCTFVCVWSFTLRCPRCCDLLRYVWFVTVCARLRTPVPTQLPVARLLPFTQVSPHVPTLVPGSSSTPTFTFTLHTRFTVWLYILVYVHAPAVHGSRHTAVCGSFGWFTVATLHTRFVRVYAHCHAVHGTVTLVHPVYTRLITFYPRLPIRTHLRFGSFTVAVPLVTLHPPPRLPTDLRSFTLRLPLVTLRLAAVGSFPTTWFAHTHTLYYTHTWFHTVCWLYYGLHTRTLVSFTQTHTVRLVYLLHIPTHALVATVCLVGFGCTHVVGWLHTRWLGLVYALLCCYLYGLRCTPG